MKKNKRYIVLITILIIYIIIMIWWLGADNVKKSNNSTTILVGDNTVWNYSDKQWLNITNNNTIKQMNWKKFNVYLDNEKQGKYYLWHDDKWYLFDEDKNAVNKTGQLIAFRSNYNIKVENFIETEVEDNTYIHKVLLENDLSISSKFTTKSMTLFDIDNDGVEEQFYVISNVFALDFTPDTIFSIVFMLKDNKIYYIYNDISQNIGNNGCKPYLNSFIDVNEDNNYELIVSCGRYSISEPVDMLYGFNKEKFKILISNQ